MGQRPLFGAATAGQDAAVRLLRRLEVWALGPDGGRTIGSEHADHHEDVVRLLRGG